MLAKRLCSILFAYSSIFYTNTATAELSTKPKDWSLGIALGAPTALVAQNQFSSNRAVDFGLGYHWSNFVQVYSDYLFLFPEAIEEFTGESASGLIPYVGLGGAVSMYNSDHKTSIGNNDANTVLSARVPLGILWQIPQSPIELFAEAVPTIYLAPGLYLGVGGDIGCRIHLPL